MVYDVVILNFLSIVNVIFNVIKFELKKKILLIWNKFFWG